MHTNNKKSGLHTGFVYWGDTHISAASRGSGGMLPKKIFCVLRWTLTQFWGGGGGGELKLEGGNPSAPPLYATLESIVLY